MKTWQIEDARDYMKLAKKEIASLKNALEALEMNLNGEEPNIEDLNFWCGTCIAWVNCLSNNLKNARKTIIAFKEM